MTGSARSDDTLIAHAHQIGTGHGTTDGENFELDHDRATGIQAVFSDTRAFVDFRHEHHTALTEAARAAQPTGEIDPHDAAVFQPLGITADHPAAADVRLAYDQGYNDAKCRVIQRRAALMVRPPSPSAPHGYFKLRVVLTATSNPFLAPRLPLAGELEVFETSVDNVILPNATIFRAARPDGTLGGPAQVRDIAFVYANRAPWPPDDKAHADMTAPDHRAEVVISFLDELSTHEINLFTELDVAEGATREELMERIRAGLRRLYSVHGSTGPVMSDPDAVSQHLGLVPPDADTQRRWFAAIGMARDLDMLMHEAEVIDESDRAVLDGLLREPNAAQPGRAQALMEHVLDAVLNRGVELLMKALDDLARGAERDYMPPPDAPPATDDEAGKDGSGAS